MSDFIWVEKYRPKKIEECILPQGIKDTFLQFLKQGEIPNLLLSGPAGCGKTTVAKALCHELGVDCYVICLFIRFTRLVTKCLCPYSPYFVHTQLGFLEGSRR